MLSARSWAQGLPDPPDCGHLEQTPRLAAAAQATWPLPAWLPGVRVGLLGGLKGQPVAQQPTPAPPWKSARDPARQATRECNPLTGVVIGQLHEHT